MTTTQSTQATQSTRSTQSTGSRVSTTRSVGRPRRVTRSMIAQAAYEVGLTDLTMRAVADRLGVSTTSLYYHVRDRDDLMRLVAEYSASKLVLPEDRGQHWTVWLYEWAEYAREAFAGQPGLLEQFLNGTIGLDKMLPNIDRVIALMEREGFGADEALRAYALVSNVAVGEAVGELRRGGPPTRQSIDELGSTSGTDRYEHLSKVTTTYRTDDGRESLFDQILTVLIGIAVRRGDEPSVVTSNLVEKPDANVAQSGTDIGSIPYHP